MDITTRIRYYHFIAGVLANQQHDPLCCLCRAYTNSVRAVREGVDEFMRVHAAELPASPSEEISIMLAEVRKMLGGLNPVPDAVGQKKAGNCMLPKGVCFVKSSKALADKPGS